MISMMQGIGAMRSLEDPEAIKEKEKCRRPHNKGVRIREGLSKEILDMVAIKAYTINDLAFELRIGRDSTVKLVDNLKDRLSINVEKVGSIQVRVIRGIGLKIDYIKTGVTCKNLNYRSQ